MLKVVTRRVPTVKTSVPTKALGEIHLLPPGSVAYGFVVCGLVTPIVEKHPEKKNSIRPWLA